MDSKIDGIPNFTKGDIDFLPQACIKIASPSINDFSQDEDPPPKIYDLNHLPPPGIVSNVLDAFYSCSGTLFYILSREDSFGLFRSLYWGESSRTRASLAEICAIVVVGCQYDYEGVSEAHRQAFFETAKVYSEDLMKDSDLRTMRLYTLFTMYNIMEKRIAAWSYVGIFLPPCHIFDHLG